MKIYVGIVDETVHVMWGSNSSDVTSDGGTEVLPGDRLFGITYDEFMERGDGSYEIEGGAVNEQ